jgi:hypothetical protein
LKGRNEEIHKHDMEQRNVQLSNIATVLDEFYNLKLADLDLQTNENCILIYTTNPKII